MKILYREGIVKGIGDWLKENDFTISTAESCTGGRIAAALTSVSGASKYFDGGIVAYCNDIKQTMLSVNYNTIKKYDVVSEEVVREMVKGSVVTFGSDFAIATTGYAGTSENDKIAPGTIWIGVGSYTRVITMPIFEDNGREKNIENAVNKALTLFFTEYVKDKK